MVKVSAATLMAAQYLEAAVTKKPELEHLESVISSVVNVTLKTKKHITRTVFKQNDEEAHSAANEGGIRIPCVSKRSSCSTAALMLFLSSQTEGVATKDESFFALERWKWVASP
ncbi:uncharacterized protein LOC122643173 [Telopea speciosissima]|uniref:uncharacterized protein LOC122643173 n=1 Tax=Telopea speciosissima TaxID=54955 RepID=UPI001CC7F7FB|nr:uncharacterized protein LOC122643173 [Telopea speciosissima]